MTIHLNTKTKGITHIHWTNKKLNEEYAKLIKSFLKGKTPLSKLYDFVNEHAPGILRKEKNTEDGQRTD